MSESPGADRGEGDRKYSTITGSTNTSNHMSTTTTASEPTSASTRTAPRIPPGMHTVTPHLVCANTPAAIEFYKKAFGAAEITRIAGPDGRIWHAQIKIGDSPIMLVDEFPEMGSRGPKSIGATPVTLHLYVDNADVTFNQAVRAGCSVRMPLADMFWGDRYGLLEDPFGHSWSVATHQRDICEEELAEIARNMHMGPECGGGASA